MKVSDNKTNWELFKQLVDEKIELQVPIKNENEKEKEVDRLLDIIHFRLGIYPEIIK